MPERADDAIAVPCSPESADGPSLEHTPVAAAAAAPAERSRQQDAWRLYGVRVQPAHDSLDAKALRLFDHCSVRHSGGMKVRCYSA